MIDPGDMREMVLLLMPVHHEEGNRYTMEPYADTWASVEAKNGKNLFSSVGLGADTYEFKIRNYFPVKIGHGLQWGDERFYITRLEDKTRAYLRITAARVWPAEARLLEVDGWESCGYLTEKYMGHNPTQAPDYVTETFVLILPKPVTCRIGDLVEVRDGVYRVIARHELDPHKNEYEIQRVVDA